MICALVLAAGRSRRAGGANKLLAPIAGKAAVRYVVDALAASRVDRILAVTGHDGAAVERALAGSGADFVRNAAWGEGLASSLRAGLAALAPATGAALVCLGDMPAVSPRSIGRILAARAGAGGRAVVPTCRGRRGNPVLWERRFFPAMARLAGDRGARGLIDTDAGLALEVETGDDGVLMDIDTPAALARVRAAMPPAGRDGAFPNLAAASGGPPCP